ncbi:hypothetical protein IQ37_06640 [Chryseobacterium piperi]|uniref:Uncharacterized protein n=1 Tax=Chryseobacterium piperi TaxID=558152 RepID=A0A086BJW6_9FLAO|nr:hypothetical protein CJF12_05430 [Chryseobacterium piperi]KFF29230.1 hypothetical protein IQ37_06640 [Chryseobacterium piperi]
MSDGIVENSIEILESHPHQGWLFLCLKSKNNFKKQNMDYKEKMMLYCHERLVKTNWVSNNTKNTVDVMTVIC